jgi:hypothetical protein
MRRLDGGRRDISAEREKHIGLRANEVRGKIGETLRPAPRITVLNREVVAFDVAEIAQRATGCFHLWIRLRRTEQQNGQTRDPCRLLRLRQRRGWPGASMRFLQFLQALGMPAPHLMGWLTVLVGLRIRCSTENKERHNVRSFCSWLSIRHRRYGGDLR